MCAGRATHQPTSNGEENIACRNKSLIRGVSNAVCSKNKSPLAPRDGSGGRPYESQNRISNLSVGFPNSSVNKNSRA